MVKFYAFRFPDPRENALIPIGDFKGKTLPLPLSSSAKGDGFEPEVEGVRTLFGKNPAREGSFDSLGSTRSIRMTGWEVSLVKTTFSWAVSPYNPELPSQFLR